MARDPDNGLRAKFHDKLPQIHWQAIEVGVLGKGIPDTNFCWRGSEGWVEMKFTDTHAVGLMPEQVGWILRRMRSGGRVFVATWRMHDGGPRRGEAVSELWLHEGWDAGRLKAEGLLAAPPVLLLEGGPSRWDWGLVGQTLVEWEFGRGPSPT